MASRASIQSGPQCKLLVLLLVLLWFLPGCPPYFVAFRPEAAVGLKNLGLRHQDPDSVVVVDTVDFSVSALRWQYSGGYIDVQLRFGDQRKLPIQLRTADLYVTDDRGRRFDLYQLQHDGEATGWVTAYHGVAGEKEIQDLYVLDPNVRNLHLTFAADFEHFPEHVVFHLEGIEAGGQSLAFVYRYQVDCNDLGKEGRRIQRRFKSVGPFEVCGGPVGR